MGAHVVGGLQGLACNVERVTRQAIHSSAPDAPLSTLPTASSNAMASAYVSIRVGICASMVCIIFMNA
jgi:hypothetical protein